MADAWLLLVVMFGGAYYDVAEHRIPNWWCLGAVISGAGFLGLTAARGTGALEVMGFFARAVAVTAVLFPLFLLRMMGAGDIKLMAIMAGYLGFSSGMRAIGFGCIIGAVLALLKMIMQRNLRNRLEFLFAYFKRLILTKEIVPYYRPERDGYGVVIPFAVCLLAGYLWFLAGVGGNEMR